MPMILLGATGQTSRDAARRSPVAVPPSQGGALRRCADSPSSTAHTRLPLSFVQTYRCFDSWFMAELRTKALRRWVAGFASDERGERAFVDDLRVLLLGRVELTLADLFADHQVRGPFFHLVVDLAAVRADIRMHVLALAAQHARHTK